MSVPAGIVSGLDAQRLAERGIPQRLTKGNDAAYLSAFVTDPGVTVTAAAARAGLTPSTIRQRRSRDPIFAAAESAVRDGRKYLPPEPPREGTPQPLSEFTPSFDDGEPQPRVAARRSVRRTTRAPLWSQ